MTAQKDLSHLGEILKMRRSERNISLKEIENATSIRMNYLSAIEEGHLGKLISPIYAQGFIKKYAAFLEIDGELLLKDHPFLSKALAEPQNDTPDYNLGIGSMETRGTPGTEVKWLPNLLWVAISIGGILTLWFLGRYFNVI